MRGVSLFVAVIVFVGLPGLAVMADGVPAQPWSIGYAEADITPAPGQVQMRGFGRERYAKGALAPLLTQVVALRDRDARTAILITADIAGFERVMTEAIRRAIARKHNIPARDVVLAASHTHWGPATQFHATAAAGAPNVWYMAFLEDTILAAVDAALADLAPAGIEYGAIDFRAIGCNRRLPRAGRITWGPYPAGSFDGHTPIVRIRRDTSPRQVVLVGHACHPHQFRPSREMVSRLSPARCAIA